MIIRHSLQRSVFPLFRSLRALATHTKASRIVTDEAGQPELIEITESAVQRIKEIRERKGDECYLRLSVESGGCHGFQYKFELAPPGSLSSASDDIVFERGGSRVVVDRVSLGLLAGSQIDFSRELIGSTFRVIQNPHAESGCGCGISFNITHK